MDSMNFWVEQLVNMNQEIQESDKSSHNLVKHFVAIVNTDYGFH